MSKCLKIITFLWFRSSGRGRCCLAPFWAIFDLMFCGMVSVTRDRLPFLMCVKPSSVK